MSEWTVDTLREHVFAMFGEKDRAVQAALASQKELATMALENSNRAVAKAETATERRFEGVNEFRETLADQQRTLMPRAEAELQLNTMEKKSIEVEKRIAALEARGRGFFSGWGWAVAIVGAVATILGVLLNFKRGAP